METLQGVELVIMIEQHRLDNVRERLLVAGGGTGQRWRSEANLEAAVVVQVSDGGVLGQKEKVNDKRWLNACYILKTELTGFTDSFEYKVYEEQRSHEYFKDFGFFKRENSFTSY